MRKYLLSLALAAALCVGVTNQAYAAPSLEAVALIGSGMDTGNAKNNPYALQVGGAAELHVVGYVLGVRATRSMATNADCMGSSNCRDVKDLRTLGADLGWDWTLAFLHLSPRLGIGQVREVHPGLKAPYLEPGGVAEVELGMFVGGIDVRYRVAVKDNIASGVLAYARLGLRF